MRAAYRRAFGLRTEQKLVVVSTTWGAPSLTGTAPELPRILAEKLPSDEFRIVLAPHPNIAAEHSPWQVDEYLSAARRAGLHVSPDVDFWRAAILAAHVVVGDHSSVGFYSAALGSPLILATAPQHTVDPRSPIAQLLAAAPRLDPTADPAAQLRQVIDTHDPQRFSAITALTTSEPDSSPAILRTAMYRTMNLPEPPEPAEISAIALPTERLNGPTAHLVLVDDTGAHAATVTRYPAERLRSDTTTLPGAHIAVGVDEPRRQWLRLADVVIGADGSDTAAWICETLARMPGCAIAAAPDEAGHWLAGTADGSIIGIAGPDSACRLFVSVAYHRIQNGTPTADLAGSWTLTCAGRTDHLMVAPVHDGSVRVNGTGSDGVDSVAISPGRSVWTAPRRPAPESPDPCR
ncbi:hypothetical protein [Nocardia cyriacigeorgica]|uniref:hypothetical protein n=1 Tax=Nocardia cyriacigeorgica TaxID=135487 RepID=UPI00245511CE|nr:hypothetical protein [Nocardia cyriacigeorgica]